MNALYSALRKHGRFSLEYEEARQIFLWIYCTLDVLPEELRDKPIDKRALVSVFEKLDSDGIIRPAYPPGESASTESVDSTPWADTVDALLSGSISLDPDFGEKVRAYFD